MSVLLAKTLPGRFRSRKVLGRLPESPIHRHGPELMGEIGPFRYIDKKARENGVEVKRPRFVTQGIHSRRKVAQRKILANDKSAVAKSQCRHGTRFEVRVAKQRGASMAWKQLHVQGVGVGIGFTRKGVRNGAAMKKRHMIDFLKGVFDDLPVGLHLRGPRSAGGRNSSNG